MKHDHYFIEYLKARDACGPGVEFALRCASPADAWRRCNDASQMLWLLERVHDESGSPLADAPTPAWLVRKAVDVLDSVIRSSSCAMCAPFIDRMLELAEKEPGRAEPEELSMGEFVAGFAQLARCSDQPLKAEDIRAIFPRPPLPTRRGKGRE